MGRRNRLPDWSASGPDVQPLVTTGQARVERRGPAWVLYSYWTPVKALLPGGILLTTIDRYSRTTSKHMGLWHPGETLGIGVTEAELQAAVDMCVLSQGLPEPLRDRLDQARREVQQATLRVEQWTARVTNVFTRRGRVRSAMADLAGPGGTTGWCTVYTDQDTFWAVPDGALDEPTRRRIEGAILTYARAKDLREALDKFTRSVDAHRSAVDPPAPAGQPQEVRR